MANVTQHISNDVLLSDFNEIKPGDVKTDRREAPNNIIAAAPTNPLCLLPTYWGRMTLPS